MSSEIKEYPARFPDLQWTKLLAPEQHPHYVYYGFTPGKTHVLEKGHRRFPGRRPLPCDASLEFDVAIPMRDGVTLYADIFRPVDAGSEQQYPAILPWSPYGKTGTGVQHYDNMAPYRVGLRLDQTSGYEKFEGPDPADWISRGYVIVNIDARGVGKSGGNVVFWGQQEAEDIYDTVEWISKQVWCNGSVGMAGNSWLAIAQINFASRLEHPALKAIAPWESRNDIYRDSLSRGGRKHNEGLHKYLLAGFAGPNSAENMPLMLHGRPFFDDYWESKYIHPENISIPVYVVASYSSQLHSRGAFQVFRSAKTSSKWLRVHPYQEWYDQYRPGIVDDLQKFFDRFLKGEQNDWEDTPAVRLSLLGFEASGGLTQTVLERSENEWPLARQVLKKFYLNPNSKKLEPEPTSNISRTSHSATDLHDSSDFSLQFKKRTELAGYPMVNLWMSCEDKDDLDVAVQIRKISSDGKLLEHLNYPCPVPIDKVPNVNTAKCLGPQGFLRASHGVSRVDNLSTEQEIFYKHDRREAIPQGSVVKVQITLWPIGMVFAPGEGIVLRVAGHDMCYPETDKIGTAAGNNENVGNHVIHAGGKYSSFVSLPFI
ncbi:Alpha/Beta hydrolase protein [Aspergillus pseudoustus]|uniref:Alpha/Beta hydrolase protein n=1 Tax=Aspergillus pseudoustus TaxID=1810923 RepID=A0ABR4JUI7_9EURO